MGLSSAFSLLRAAASRRWSARRGGPPWVYAVPSGTPLVGAWTDSRIEQVRHFRHWVYVATDRIAKQIAPSMPCVSVCRDTGDPSAKPPANPERFLSARRRAKALVPLQVSEELEPVGNEHPLVRLLRDPNGPDTGYDLWYETVMYLLLTGSAYWWCPRNRANRPSEVWVIPSHWVWPVPDKKHVVGSYQIRPVEGVFTGSTVPAEDVIHFRFKSPVSKIDGFSPQTAIAQWIDSAESVDRTRWFSFKNGPMPQLKVEFTELNPSQEMLDRIEARMSARYVGEHNAARPFLVPKGAKVEPLWISPKELDFRVSFEQLRDSILAAFGVPAVVAGITKNMTYGSVLAAQAGFCQFAINPLLAFLGQVITEKLAREYDEKLRVWWPDQTPDDPNVVLKQLQLNATFGLVTYNEARAEQGRKPWPGGDVPIEPPQREGGESSGSGGESSSEKWVRRARRRVGKSSEQE